MNSISSFFLDKKRKTNLAVHVVTEKTFDAWLKKQPKDVKQGMKSRGFTGRPARTVLIPGGVVIGVTSPASIYALSRRWI